MKLLPQEWVENCLETYLYQHCTASQKIYWVVLTAITAVLISLPFIYIDISVQSNGIVRPIAEKTEVNSPVNELVDSVYITEGTQIKKGDIILRFRTNNSDYKINYQSNQLDDQKAHLADLTYLAKGVRPQSFCSPTRYQEYIYFTKRINELENSIAQAQKEYLRNKVLYEKKVIPEEEYDKTYYQYESQKNELASFKESQLNTWQTNLNNYRNTYEEINSLLKQEIKNKELYILRSPVSGTVDQFTGIYRGSNIQTGQSVAIISPDSTLYFEIYVEPRNIGYLNRGMPVNVQIESFNYNEWGTISGKIKEISSDFITDNQGNAYYKVKCTMDTDFLTLRNGYKGHLKKGMTVNAHFMITRRSLFDLLYQKMDDWINPTQYEKDQMINKS